jgi:hypothetical protein
MNCSECQHPVAEQLDHCPHCGRPALFPNVRQVEDPAEVDALDQRHANAVADTKTRGCEDAANKFEAAAAAAQAIIARPIEEALRLASADDQAYATYYELLHSGLRLPTGNRWDRLRQLADTELFGSIRGKIRFAALSVDGASLSHYGEVALQLAEPMIEHRATVFEENSAVFFERQRRMGIEPPRIAGYRARWRDRGRLALAKHHPSIVSTSHVNDYPRMLIRSGSRPEDDVFIEVHVYGSLTRRSLARAVIQKGKLRRAFVARLAERLRAVGVQVEVR